MVSQLLAHGAQTDARNAKDQLPSDVAAAGVLPLLQGATPLRGGDNGQLTFFFVAGSQRRARA